MVALHRQAGKGDGEHRAGSGPVRHYLGTMDGTTKGRLLVASPVLGDPNFNRTVVFMLEHSEEGAVGLVINRPSDVEIDEPLEDWSRFTSAPSVVFIGGPVSREAVIALARVAEGRLA